MVNCVVITDCHGMAVSDLGVQIHTSHVCGTLLFPRIVLTLHTVLVADNDYQRIQPERFSPCSPSTKSQLGAGDK